jgi:hypothetical protein
VALPSRESGPSFEEPGTIPEGLDQLPFTCNFYFYTQSFLEIH